MVPGNYPLHKFYGVIGTRPSFGAGERYPAFNREWTTMGYETISVSYNCISGQRSCATLH